VFSLYITYLFLGFSLALPPGAMTVEMTKQGLKNGFYHGWFVGIGGMTIDLTLILMIYLGFSTISELPYLQEGMWLTGSLFLLYLGYDSINHANHGISLGNEKTTKSFRSSYFNGVMMALSPSNLAFWLGIFGTLLASSLENTDSTHFILVALGILSGILLHDLGLLGILAYTRKFVKKSFIKWTSIVAGFILIGFSLYFAYRFVGSIREYM
jgi:threonine/homoserine/homoserine lactone efflux protein